MRNFVLGILAAVAAGFLLISITDEETAQRMTDARRSYMTATWVARLPKATPTAEYPVRISGYAPDPVHGANAFVRKLFTADGRLIGLVTYNDERPLGWSMGFVIMPGVSDAEADRVSYEAYSRVLVQFGFDARFAVLTVVEEACSTGAVETPLGNHKSAVVSCWNEGGAMFFGVEAW